LRPWLRRTLVLLAVLTAARLLLPLGLASLGHWLLVDDPLEPATAAVVFGGHVPFRAMEAAAIFQKGLVHEVWLTQGAIHLEDDAMAKLGIHEVPEHEYSRQVLERLGVPPASIRILDEPVDNTAEEVTVIAQEMRRVGGKRIILLTSKNHTRRVRVTWQKLVGDAPQAIVRYTPDDPYNPDRWWHNSRQALSVAREAFGLLNAWAGFPLNSRE
jgi:uncharacterized SAM-binding protein YcdF (DUF218 family)